MFCFRGFMCPPQGNCRELNPPLDLQSSITLVSPLMGPHLSEPTTNRKDSSMSPYPEWIKTSCTTLLGQLQTGRYVYILSIDEFHIYWKLWKCTPLFSIENSFMLQIKRMKTEFWKVLLIINYYRNYFLYLYLFIIFLQCSTYLRVKNQSR